MSFKQTATTKEILPNYECIDLAKRLKNAVDNKEISFIQALYDIATPALIAELETIIAMTNRLNNSAFLTEEELKIKKYLLGSRQSYEGNEKKNYNSSNVTNVRRIWKPTSISSAEASE